ncbi:hypothetical protein PS870_01609 [Pseudomonas fluorescens]|uniref:Lipoprotein n=1 Tax=Pseudomonas fluorescens TaxID=294 RepID=A0A5E7IL06_PSEFL|nr:hypothetical protein PS870_01609 [Pseudomonas fluorescens]
MLLLTGCISIPVVTAAGGFALTASPFCQTPQKEPKSLAPSVRPLAKARRSFAPVSIRGHCPPVCFATTYMQRVRLRRTALRATPRMNTSTQPPEGAGGSRSKAGELTLGLMSGEERSVYSEPLVGARLAREGGLTADQSLLQVPTFPCRSEACPRRRPDSRPISFASTHIPL